MGYMGRQERFSYRFIGALIDEITRTGLREDRKLRAQGIEAALKGINSAEDKIASGLQTIESRQRMILTKLDDGLRLNDWGEFQSAPVEVDQAIVARQAFFDVLAVLCTKEELEMIMVEAKRHAT